MKDFFRDLRYGWRTLLKSRGFTAGAVLTLALGIGANGTIFSWVNSTLLNPLPGVHHTRGLMSLGRGGASLGDLSFSYPDYLDLRDHSQSFTGLTAFSMHPMSLTGVEKPARIWGTTVSTNYFSVLDVKPILGRALLATEEVGRRGAPVAVISHHLWQSRFGQNPLIIGSTINIDHHPYTIVGVMPALFQGSQTGLRADIWIPVTMEQDVLPGPDLCQKRDANWLLLQGRLKPGVSEKAAQAELSTLMQQIATQFPDSHRGNNTVSLFPLWRSPLGANGQLYFALQVLAAVAGIVLLLACVNVANLLLVRYLARRHEIAIRLSMGARRWHVIRQLLSENLLLAVAGGAAAMLLTTGTAGTFAALLPPTSLPLALNGHMDTTVLLTILAIAVASSAVFGILPALQLSRLAPVTILKDDSGTGSGNKTRLTSSLVVVQICLSLLLLVCAGLSIRSFGNSLRFYPGFQPDHVLLTSFDLFPSGYTEANGKQFQRQVLAKIKALPGVQSTSLATWVPLQYDWRTAMINPEGYVAQTHESLEVGIADVGPNYFQTMQIPLAAGREFTFEDTEKTEPVLVVNQSLAARYWPNSNPIGKRLQVWHTGFRVIGVAANSNYATLGETPQPFAYIPLFQDYEPSVVVHARISGEAMSLAPLIESAIHEQDATLTVFDVTSLQARVQAAAAVRRIAGMLAGTFGLLALVLAGMGIYGVVAYTARQRTRELGIRIALGAPRRQVFQMVLGWGLRLTLIGLAIGLVLSVAMTHMLGQLLFGTSPLDPLTFASVVLLLAAVAFVACYGPALRAMRIDPLMVLRNE